jgi:hypothetical protein
VGSLKTKVAVFLNQSKQATILLLKEYLEQQDFTDPYIRRPEFAHLLAILNKQLTDTKRVLAKVVSGLMAMNEHFDIFELTLRRYQHYFLLSYVSALLTTWFGRYYHQFMGMFPISKAKRLSFPSLLISDPAVLFLSYA